MAQNRPDPPKPDLTGFTRDFFFDRGTHGFHGLSHSGHFLNHQIAGFMRAIVGEVGYATPPDLIPLDVLESVGWNPMVHLGEMALASPISDPELFWIKHDDPKVVAQTEAWLRPIFRKLLLELSRTLAWGAIPVIFDWIREPLVVKPVDGGQRSRVIQHTHYCGSHEIWPGHASPILDESATRIDSIKVNDVEYKSDRAFLFLWDDQFGRFRGRGSRRFAFRPWYQHMLAELWHGRWLERSVDPPRIGFAPSGDIEINGVSQKATKVLARALMSLKGGSATGLPSTMDEETNQRVWAVEVMNLPDRKDTWHKALDRYDAQMLMAGLVPPAAVGAETLTLSGARVPAQTFVDFVDAALKNLAHEATRVVRVVHITNRTNKREAHPEVMARELPVQKRKLLLEVFRVVANITRHVGEGKVVTLAEQIDDSLIDDLGLRKIPQGEAAREPVAPMFGPPGQEDDEDGPPQGRPRDTTSDREGRRDRARRPEGDDATGGRRDGED